MAKRTSDKSANAKVKPSAKASLHTIYHKDGSIWGRGQMLGGKMHGSWEFYRKDGTIMRSGTFDRGQQIGTWTTYDAAGKPVKVTEMKPAANARPGAHTFSRSRDYRRSNDSHSEGSKKRERPRAPRAGQSISHGL